MFLNLSSIWVLFVKVKLIMDKTEKINWVIKIDSDLFQEPIKQMRSQIKIFFLWGFYFS